MPATDQNKKAFSPECLLLRLYICDPKYSDILKIREEICLAARREGLPSKIIDAFSLAATEIISNILNHPEKAAGYVAVKMTHNRNEAVLDIADDSAPFHDFQLKRGASLKKLAEGPLSGSEGGRGLGIIARTMTTVNYTPAEQSSDGDNHFVVSKNLKSDTSSSAKDVSQEKPLVFIIDDDDIFREMTIKMLSSHYRVRDFSQAPDAVAAFEQDEPELVISDLMMPEMNGIELRKALSTLKNGDTTPFVFLSGFGESVEQSYINQLGIDDFLHKPVRKDQLLAVLGRLLSRSRQIRQKIRGEVGEDISSVLRPTLPETLGPWRTELRNIMAEAGGGDFVLFSQTPVGSSVILADVMGHGMTAKFFAYAYAGYLRSLFHVNKNMTAPGDFLLKLSECVEKDPFLESQVVTCQALWLTHDGRIMIASAGHPWPLLMRNGSAEIVEISGPLPGLMSDMPYQTLSLQLSPGDRIALYTDGFLDRFTAHKDIRVSTNRIRENLLQTGNLPLAKITDTMWGKFLKQEDGSGVVDDATFIILEYTQQEEK